MEHESHQANGRQPARRVTVAPPPATPSESEILERACRHFRLRTRGDLDQVAGGSVVPAAVTEPGCDPVSS